MYKILTNFNYMGFDFVFYSKTKYDKIIFITIFFLFHCTFEKPNITLSISRSSITLKLQHLRKLNSLCQET